MDFIIKRIINNPIDSNCFVIYSDDSLGCVIVDPGSKDSSELIHFLKNNNLSVEYIILTHEHFDHIWGVNDLKSIYNESKIITTQLCGDKIINKKKNMSVFYDQIGFETYPCDISIESISYSLAWNGMNFNFIKTPGHTDCGMSIVFSNKIFVGDLIIPGYLTVTKLPSGSKNDLLKSFYFIIENYKESNLRVYPGHGNSFLLNNIDFKDIL
ncbi:MAG: MBL fold metallo-hydrolase [Gelidibacter sp.]|nr:MBL fold metallo-hydrolase [Gelidibacter sp.]